MFEHQAERAKLVFLSLSVVLAQLASLAMEDSAGNAVATLAPIELGQRPPALHEDEDVAGIVVQGVVAKRLGVEGRNDI